MYNGARGQIRTIVEMLDIKIFKMACWCVCVYSLCLMLLTDMQLHQTAVSDSPLRGHFLQLFRWDRGAFPDQPRDVVPPACPGSSPGCPPDGTCPAHVPREAFRRYPKKMSEPHLPGRMDVEEKRLYNLSRSASPQLISAACVQGFVL